MIRSSLLRRPNKLVPLQAGRAKLSSGKQLTLADKIRNRYQLPGEYSSRSLFLIWRQGMGTKKSSLLNHIVRINLSLFLEHKRAEQSATRVRAYRQTLLLSEKNQPLPLALSGPKLAGEQGYRPPYNWQSDRQGSQKPAPADLYWLTKLYKQVNASPHPVLAPKVRGSLTDRGGLPARDRIEDDRRMGQTQPGFWPKLVYPGLRPPKSGADTIGSATNKSGFISLTGSASPPGFPRSQYRLGSSSVSDYLVTKGGDRGSVASQQIGRERDYFKSSSPGSLSVPEGDTYPLFNQAGDRSYLVAPSGDQKSMAQQMWRQHGDFKSRVPASPSWSLPVPDGGPALLLNQIAGRSYRYRNLNTGQKRLPQAGKVINNSFNWTVFNSERNGGYYQPQGELTVAQGLLPSNRVQPNLVNRSTSGRLKSPLPDYRAVFSLKPEANVIRAALKPLRSTTAFKTVSEHSTISYLEKYYQNLFSNQKGGWPESMGSVSGNQATVNKPERINISRNHKLVSRNYEQGSRLNQYEGASWVGGQNQKWWGLWPSHNIKAIKKHQARISNYLSNFLGINNQEQERVSRLIPLNNRIGERPPTTYNWTGIPEPIIRRQVKEQANRSSRYPIRELRYNQIGARIPILPGRGISRLQSSPAQQPSGADDDRTAIIGNLLMPKLQLKEQRETRFQNRYPSSEHGQGLLRDSWQSRADRAVASPTIIDLVGARPVFRKQDGANVSRQLITNTVTRGSRGWGRSVSPVSDRLRSQPIPAVWPTKWYYQQHLTANGKGYPTTLLVNKLVKARDTEYANSAASFRDRIKLGGHNQAISIDKGVAPVAIRRQTRSLFQVAAPSSSWAPTKEVATSPGLMRHIKSFPEGLRPRLGRLSISQLGKGKEQLRELVVGHNRPTNIINRPISLLNQRDKTVSRGLKLPHLLRPTAIFSPRAQVTTPYQNRDLILSPMVHPSVIRPVNYPQVPLLNLKNALAGITSTKVETGTAGKLGRVNQQAVNTTATISSVDNTNYDRPQQQAVHSTLYPMDNRVSLVNMWRSNNKLNRYERPNNRGNSLPTIMGEPILYRSILRQRPTNLVNQLPNRDRYESALSPGTAVEPVSTLHNRNRESSSIIRLQSELGQRTPWYNQFSSAANLNYRRETPTIAAGGSGNDGQIGAKAINTELRMQMPENKNPELNVGEIKKIADRVYREIQQRMKSERQHRGL